MKILVSSQNVRHTEKMRGVQRCATQLVHALGRMEGVEVDVSVWFQADAGVLYALSAPYNAFVQESQAASRNSAVATAGAIAMAPAALLMLAVAEKWPGLVKIGKKLDYNGALKKKYRQAKAAYQTPQGGESMDTMEERHPSAVWRDVDHYDAVLSFEFMEELWKQPLCLARKAKTVCIVHDLIFTRMNQAADNWQYKNLEVFENIVHRADGLLCNSKATQNDVERLFPKLATPMTFAHLANTVANSPGLNFSGKRVDKTIVTRRNRKNAYSIMMLGDIDRRKNLFTALRAVPLLARLMPEKKIVLNVVGNTDNVDSMGAALVNARACAEVNFCGYLSDSEVGRLFDGSDVFLFPSIWEGFGFPILEAYAHGVPVVTSEVSSMPEVGGELGKYVDPYDPDDIADALFAVSRMAAEEREAFAAKAKDRAAGFTWEKTGAKCLEFIDSVLRATS